MYGSKQGLLIRGNEIQQNYFCCWCVHQKKDAHQCLSMSFCWSPREQCWIPAHWGINPKSDNPANTFNKPIFILWRQWWWVVITRLMLDGIKKSKFNMNLFEEWKKEEERRRAKWKRWRRKKKLLFHEHVQLPKAFFPYFILQGIDHPCTQALSK